MKTLKGVAAPRRLRTTVLHDKHNHTKHHQICVLQRSRCTKHKVPSNTLKQLYSEHLAACRASADAEYLIGK